MGDPATDLTDPLVVAVSRRIAAPPATIFSVLRDPSRHPEFDGTGMVRGSEDPPVDAVGDVFVTRMHNDEMGDYQMRNVVIEFVPDRAVAWAPKRHDIDEEDWDHRWGWRLEPAQGATDVTAFFDCTRVPEDGRRILRDGERWRPDMERSLEQLAAIVA